MAFRAGVGFVPARGGCPGDAQTKRRARTLRSGV